MLELTAGFIRDIIVQPSPEFQLARHAVFQFDQAAENHCQVADKRGHDPNGRQRRDESQPAGENARRRYESEQDFPEEREKVQYVRERGRVLQVAAVHGHRCFDLFSPSLPVQLERMDVYVGHQHQTVHHGVEVCKKNDCNDRN